MNSSFSQPASPAIEPSEDEIREYAFHLYELDHCADGHHLQHWLEATACLKANIPRHDSNQRLHPYPAGSGQTKVFAESAMSQILPSSPEAPHNARRGRST